jgi:hypothetical protein
MSGGSSCYTSGNSKGRKTDTYTSEARKKQCFSSLELARVARYAQPSTDSAAVSSMTTSTTTSVTPTDLSRCTTRITHGVAGDTFVESERLDWRSFGRKTYQDWVANGWVGMVQEKIRKYHMATSAVRAQRVLVFQSEVPLSFCGDRALSDRVHAVQQLLAELQGMYSAGESMNQVTAVTERLALGGCYSTTLVRQWALQLLRSGGKFSNVGYSKRTGRSVICDAVHRAEMTTWITNASRASPPATAQDFASFCNASYNCNIKKGTGQLWLAALGFKYKNASALEIYNDGHQRVDVLAHLKVYVVELLDMQRSTVTYTGKYMNTEVPGEMLQVGASLRHIISYHDECCCHASDRVTKRWSMPGRGGCMKDKSRGAARMVTGYICAEVGVWRESLRTINPGENKDGWWVGDDTQAQATAHLLEFDLLFPGCVCVDIYDNSSGHDCRAKDALDISKLNLGVGGDGKEVLMMRGGLYLDSSGAPQQQSFFFAAGDVLHVPVKAGGKCLQQLPTGDTEPPARLGAGPRL